MTTRRRFIKTALGLGLAATLPMRAWAESTETPQALVDRARISLEEMLAHPDYSALKKGIRNAHGVLIFPQVIKGGFFLGGSGGSGVLLVKNAKGDWSLPAFYTMGSVSFGLQFGGEAAEVVMLANSSKAVDSLYASSLKLGGDASVAAGPVGAGGKGSITADFVSYAKSKGAFVGMSLEGSVLDVRDSLNSAYYGKPLTPIEIVRDGKAANAGADALRAALRKATK